MAGADPAPAGLTGRGAAGGAAGPGFALLFVAGVALLWSLLPLWLQTVPHADNVEQLDWAHSLEWGYIKHPPLPTWLLIGASQLLRPGAGLTYALAMACVALSLLLLWRCGALLFDRRGAMAVLLLSSANYYLMGRGSFFNHNTVMLPFVAASAWAVLRIERDRQGGAWTPWLVLGLAQGLGMLTKYQMAVVIAGNLLALLAAGAWRQPRFLAHAALACLATVLPLLPHLAWLRTHDFSTFGYAGQSLLAALPLADRLHQTLGFALQQVGKFAPALVAGAVALLLERTASGAPAPRSAAPPLRVLGLLAFTPIALVLLLSLLAGVALQNHWGASTTLLLPLYAVAAWPHLRRIRVSRMIAAVLAVQLATAAWFVVYAQRSREFHYTFAAEPLAQQALAYWRAHAPGPLEILIGPDWETGALSLEMPTRPDVLASGERRQAPWVDDDRLRHCGALLLWRTDGAAAAQIGADFAARARDVRTLRATGPHGVESELSVGWLAGDGGACAERVARADGTGQRVAP